MANINWPFSKIVDGFGQSRLQVCTKTYLQNLVEVQPTFGSNTNAVILIGENLDINQNYVELDEGFSDSPSTHSQLQVVSTSTNDTSAGTGAQTVVLQYLDNNNDLHSENINLNGTTPVTTTATNISRVNNLFVWDVGGNGYAAGDIQVQDVGGGTAYAQITAGNNKWRSARLFIPRNWTLFITAFSFTSIDDPVRFELMTGAKSIADYSAPKVIRAQGLVDNGNMTMPFDIPIRSEELTEVTIRAKSVKNASASAMVTVTGYVIKNST